MNPIPGLPADFIKGADISVLQANINDISQRYDKDVIVVFSDDHDEDLPVVWRNAAYYG